MHQKRIHDLQHFAIEADIAHSIKEKKERHKSPPLNGETWLPCLKFQSRKCNLRSAGGGSPLPFLQFLYNSGADIGSRAAVSAAVFQYFFISSSIIGDILSRSSSHEPTGAPPSSRAEVILSIAPLVSKLQSPFLSIFSPIP